MNFKALLAKEWLDARRTYKALFLPLVFLFLGAAQPLSLHFMPQILQNASLPEGAIIEIPQMPPAAIMASVFDQFKRMGVLFIILAAMGAVAREVESGQSAFVLSLGYSRLRYLGAKWIVLSFIVVGSILIGALGAAYYTVLLFGPLPWDRLVGAALLFGLYGVFILCVTVAFSSLFENQLAVIAAAVAVPIGLSIVGALYHAAAFWLPGHLVSLAKLLAAQSPPDLWRSLLVTLAWTLLAAFTGVAAFGRRQV